MELIGVADGCPYLIDRITGQFQQFSCLDHAVTDQKFLRRFPDGFPEYFAEIAPVEPGAVGDVFHGNIMHIVVVDIGESLFDVKIPDFGIGRAVVRDRAGKRVEENIEMSDQAEDMEVIQ